MSVDHAVFRLSKALGKRKRPRDDELIPFGPAAELEGKLSGPVAMQGDPVRSVWTREGPAAVERLAQLLREFAPLVVFDPGSGAFYDPLPEDSFPPVRKPAVSLPRGSRRFEGLGRAIWEVECEAFAPEVHLTDRVSVLVLESVLAALDNADGRPLWARRVLGEPPVAVLPAAVLVARGDTLHALDPCDGRALWRSRMPQLVSACTASDAAFVVFLDDGQRLAFDALGRPSDQPPDDVLARARRPDRHTPVSVWEQEIRGKGWTATALVRVVSEAATWERSTFANDCTPLAKLDDDEILLFAAGEGGRFHLERTRAVDGMVLARTADVFPGEPNFVDLDTCGRHALVSYDCRFVALVEL